MTPLVFLMALVGITLGAWGAQKVVDSRRHGKLAKLARAWEMQFVAEDRLMIGPRIAPHLPIVGAADVVVSDLMYATEKGRRRYLFTCEFGVGVVSARRRQRRVVGFAEGVSGEEISRVVIGPEDRALAEQYGAVHDEI